MLVSFYHGQVYLLNLVHVLTQRFEQIHLHVHYENELLNLNEYIKKKKYELTLCIQGTFLKSFVAGKLH